MSIPDPLQAIADLRRCMQARDYAGAARLIEQRATLDGLNALAAPAWQSEAERVYRLSVIAWRTEHEATVQRQQERDVRALVALVAEACQGAEEGPVAVVQAARRSVLGETLKQAARDARDARSAGWPVSREAAA